MSDDVDPRDTPRHPRRRNSLLGHEKAENRLLQAYRSGRLHHAWLIGGPRGVGKATLAYRFARFLLHESAATLNRDAVSLDVAPDHPTARRTAAGSHADLFVVERRFDPRTGRLKTETGVDIARMASAFFSRSAAEGGWRICIVDTADDLNVESANALLKSLEEPPSRSIFLLLANRPGTLLRTIRSRCIQLQLESLSQQHVIEVVSGVLGAEAPSPADITLAAHLSGGSPGRALELLGSGGTRIFSEFRSLVSDLPRLDRRQALAFADQIHGPGRRRRLRYLLRIAGGLDSRSCPRRSACIEEIGNCMGLRACRTEPFHSPDKCPKPRPAAAGHAGFRGASRRHGKIAERAYGQLKFR